MLHFEINEFFYGFFLVVAIFAIFVISRIRRRKILRNFGNPELIEALYPDYSKYKPYIKTTLILLSLSALIVALANPLLGTKLVQAKRQGVDVVIALDVSNSMKAEDIKPNRLERAKQMIYKLIDKLVNDRIGLIVFAGESYVQLPLTTDYGAAKLFTSYVDTDIIPLQGTAIGSAIELAVEKFNFDEQRKKALIIITDGENHEDDALGAAPRGGHGQEADPGLARDCRGPAAGHGPPDGRNRAAPAVGEPHARRADGGTEGVGVLPAGQEARRTGFWVPDPELGGVEEGLARLRRRRARGGRG